MISAVISPVIATPPPLSPRLHRGLRPSPTPRTSSLTPVKSYPLNLALESQPVELQASLSDHEHEFVTGYVNVYQQHMDRSVRPAVDTTTSRYSFLKPHVPLLATHDSRLTTEQVWDAVDTSRIPENLKDISTTPSLNVKPKMEAHVFCRAVRQHAQPAVPGSGRAGRPRLEAPSRSHTAGPLGSRAEPRPLGPRTAQPSSLPEAPSKWPIPLPFDLQVRPTRSQAADDAPRGLPGALPHRAGQ